MNSNLRYAFVVFILTNLSLVIFAQKETTENKTKSEKKCDVSLNIGADIMSRYIFRGTDFGDSPSIQPTLSMTINNFELGCWSAISAFSKYREIDLYAKYTIKGFSFIITDYYIPYTTGGSNASPDIRYFSCKNKMTAHTLEASVMYNGSEKYPFWVMGGMFFYGNDKRWGYKPELDTTSATYFSSYFEAGYTFNVKENKIDVFAGITPTAGAYGYGFGLVNLGLTGHKSIKITKEYSLPVKGSLIFNPQANAVHFAFGITL
jgi:hypothetical protein